MPDQTFDPDKYLASEPVQNPSEGGFDPDAYLSQAPEKKNLVDTSSQDGSQGLQASQQSSSNGFPSEPLEGLGGQPSNVPSSIEQPLQAARTLPQESPESPISKYEKAQSQLAGLTSLANNAKPRMHSSGVTLKDKGEYDRLQSQINSVRGSVSEMQPEIDNAISGMLSEIDNNLGAFTTKDVSGLPVADTEKAAEFAREKAKELGLPEDGHAWKYIWNKAKDHAAFKIVEPEVNKEFAKSYEKMFGKPLEEDRKDIAERIGGVSGRVAKADAEIDIFAKQQLEEANKFAEEDLIARLGGVQPDQYVQQAQSTYEQSVAMVNQTFAGKVTPEGFAGNEAEYGIYKAQLEQAERQYNESVGKFNESAIAAEYGANRRYERNVQEYADGVYRGLNQEIEKNLKPADQFIQNRIRDAYKDAYGKVAENNEWLKTSLDRNVGSYLIRPMQSAVGGSLKAIGTITGSEDMQVYGDYIQDRYNIGSAEIEEWSDWFTDYRKALRSTGQLMGSMSTSMVPAVAVGLATGGLGAAPTFSALAGGSVAFLGETTDLAGRMYDQTFAETGDAGLATERAKKTFDSQMYLAPTYGLEMLPFVGKFSGGAVKRFFKGAAMEYATETLLQEYPQNAIEKAIMDDAELSEVYKYMSFEDLNNTAKNTVSVALMGGGGQVNQYFSEEQKAKENLEKNIKSIAAHAALGKVTEAQAQETILNIVANHGIQMADAVISAAFNGNEINYAQASLLLSDVKAAEEYVKGASELGLSDKNAYVFTNLRMKLREAERQAENEKDPAMKSIKSKRASKLKKDMEDMFNGGETRYTTLTFPNGTFQILTYDEARKKMKEEGFGQTFVDGELKFEAFGSEAEVLQNELKGALEGVKAAPKTTEQETPAQTETVQETPVKEPVSESETNKEVAPFIVAQPSLSGINLKNGFENRLVELGYSELEISNMTFEQQQDIITKNTEASRADNTAKIDAVKENKRQERIAELNKELDEQEDQTAPPLLTALKGTPVKGPSETMAEGVFQTEIDGVDVLMSEIDENTVKLESIRTPKKERGQGKAKAALAKITAEADKQGKAIVLDVVPEDAKTTEPRLRKLYEDAGFVADGKTSMRREPVKEESKIEEAPIVVSEEKVEQAETVEEVDEDILSLEDLQKAMSQVVSKEFTETPEGQARKLARTYTNMGKRGRKTALGVQVFADLQKVAKDNGFTLQPNKTGGFTVLDKNNKVIKKPKRAISKEEKAEVKAEKKEVKETRSAALMMNPISIEHWVAQQIASGTRFKKKELLGIVGENADIPAWMWAEDGLSMEGEDFLEKLKGEGFTSTLSELEAQEAAATEIARYAHSNGKREAIDYVEKVYEESQKAEEDSYTGFTEEEYLEIEAHRERTRLAMNPDLAIEIMSLEFMPEDVAQHVLDNMKAQDEYETSEQYLSDIQKNIESYESTKKGKRKDATRKKVDGDTSEAATELEKAKQELKDAWKAWKDEGKNLGFADTPENKGKRLADLEIALQKALINLARKYIATVADKAKVKVEDLIRHFTDNGVAMTRRIAEDILDIVVPVRSTEKPKKSGKTSIKRYTARTVKALSEMKEKGALEDAIKALGLRQAVVSWKKVEPLSREVIEDIFSNPSTVDQKVNELYNEILGTKNKDYVDNPELSTLHSLTFHMMLDRLYEEGMNDLYVKWNGAFQEIGAGKGRFISAMQRDASPYALRNLQLRPLYEGLNKSLDVETETGATRFEEIEKIKTLVEELLSKEELIKGYEAKVKELSEQLKKANSQQTFGGNAATGTTPSVKGKARVKAGRKLFMEGIREASGRANVGIPINDKILSGIKEMVLGLIEEGMYEASRIKKAIMKDVNEQLKDNTDAIIDIAEAIDEYFRSNEFQESRKEAMKTAFIESLENRAKSMVSGDKRAKEKGAEQVLLDALLQKLGQEIGRDAQKGSKAYQERLKSALENLEFSDDVWKSAIASVKSWLGRQEMDHVKKAEILARLEDSASLFMENPFSKSDLRRAIRDGEKEIGQSVQGIVKKHWSERNKYMETLAEKLVSELGLNAETAKKYEQAVMEEAKSYMNEKRLAAIRQALNLDKNGMRKERAEKINQRVIDKIIEAINLGMLDDDVFQGLFAEKYGIVNLTQKDVRMMEHLNDLINIHEGTDISRRYTKELADYIETLKPWTAPRVMSAIQGMTIKGMLTGLSTIAINIPVGSLYSFISSTMPSIIANPIASKAFLSEYAKAGLSKSSRRTFLDIMREGYSPQEDGLGSKFDERDIYGDPIDYMLRNYDRKKAWEEVSNAKSPKEAASAFGRMLAGQYLQVLRLANFAKAFDVLLSTRGVEFDLFLKYWNEEARAAGHPLKGRFDPSISKKFIDDVRKKMVYDTETRKEIEESVDEQIAGMKARGERVGPSYRQTLIREAMIAQRSMEDYKKAKERVASYLLMDQPTGLSSYVYDPIVKRMAIREDNNPVVALGKLGFNLTLGLFLRISITAAQRGIENIPVGGLLMPGILYDRVPSDPTNLRSDKQWRTFLNEKYDRDQMKRRLMTHASIAALTGIVAMNMFRLKDDEEEEEQENGTFKVVKKTKIVENPDRIFEVTGFSGEFFKTEQFDRTEDPRKDYYFRIKVGGKWINAVPIRLAPHFLYPTSVLGGMMDDLKFNPNADRRKRDLLIKSMDDFALASSEFSFSTIPKTVKSVYFASQRGASEGLFKVGEIMVRPIRTSVYPNAYRDVYKEIRFLNDAEEKITQGMLSPIANDFPFLEDYMGESSYDVFGYPKKATSKLIQSAEDAPGTGILTDNLLDYTAKNKERFETDAWSKKMNYFPNVEIKGYWPSGFDYSTKVEASRIYGEILRVEIEKIPEDLLKEVGIEESSKRIDKWLNGTENYEGVKSGGFHSEIVKMVNDKIGVNQLKDEKKKEFILRNTIRAILQDDIPETTKTPSMETLLKDLSESVKKRKELEEQLKPKKRSK